MNQIQERIAQWEKMTAEAPDSMAWLSLGNAYLQDNRHEDAANAFSKAIEHDAGMSRAYQLLGEAFIQLGREAEAGPTLIKGFEVAAGRGDVMPQNAMGLLLEKLGLPLPQVKQAPVQEKLTGDQILDRRTGKPGHRMEGPPMRGAVGEFIVNNFSQETWREWIMQGTKVINELRLDFSNEEHQRIYDTHMFEWLGMTAQDIEKD